MNTRHQSFAGTAIARANGFRFDEGEKREDEQLGTAIRDALASMNDAAACFKDAVTKMDARADAQDRRMDEFEKARKDYFKHDNSEEEKAKQDAARRDEEEKEKERADKARKDEEEKAAKERDDARSDEARRITGLEAKIAELSTQLTETRAIVPRPMNDADAAKLARAQAQFDEVLVPLGKRAPAPLINESELSYRKRLLTEIKPHSRAYKEADVYIVPEGPVFDAMDEQIRFDAIAFGRTPAAAPAGTLIPSVTNEGGHTFTRYAGDASAWMGPIANRSSRCVRDAAWLKMDRMDA